MATGIKFLDRMPSVTRNIIIINVIVWAFMTLFPSKVEILENLCALHYFESSHFNVAQLFTYMFLHGGFTHLFFNMFALFFFGQVLEWVLGQKRYLFYYISCGIGAALIQECVYAIQMHGLASSFTPDEFDAISKGLWYQGVELPDKAIELYRLLNGATVGASGAIYGVLLAFAMIFPNKPLYIMFIPVPVKAKWVVAGYVVIELVSGLGVFQDNVAHFAHLGGMLIGFIIITIWKKKGIINGFYY
jgi:membrane associated rhomboid family serine protease